MSKASKKRKLLRAQEHSRPSGPDSSIPTWETSETPTITEERAWDLAHSEVGDRTINDSHSRAYFDRVDALAAYLLERSRSYADPRPQPRVDYTSMWIDYEIEKYFAIDPDVNFDQGEQL